MNTKHTPGPWSTQDGRGHVKIFGSRETTGAVLVAEVRHEHDSTCSTYGMEEAANTVLIAAAPELLEALQELYELNKYQLLGTKEDKAAANARRVIAKATGGAA